MDTPARPRMWWGGWLLASALLALIPILAIMRPGLPNTADGYVHLLRALETTELVRAGHLYPRWAPDFYLGYGYPFFNFYAPGVHLLIAALASTGLGVLRGLVIAQLLALLLYPSGVFLAAYGLLSRRGERAAVAAASLAAAATYLYAPLRFRELFTQGNLSQLLALGWLPWAAWALIEAVRRGSWRWSAAAGLALAGLVYAHHPSAFLAFPALLAFALWLAAVEGRGPRSVATRRGVRLTVAAFSIGVALSAPFWLPAVAEMRYVGISGIETGMFNARQNLVPLRELLAPAAIQDDTALNPPQPISLGSLQTLLAAGGLVAAAVWVIKGDAPLFGRPRPVSGPGRRTAGGRRLGWALLGAAAQLTACLALILPEAGPLWVRLPLARLIAFPWRLLGPALLFAALLAAGAVLALPSRVRGATLLALLVLAPLSVAPYLFPRPFAPVAEPTLADIARYERSDGAARATASANEYLPAWVRDPDPPPTLVEAYLAGETPQRLDRAALPAGSQATLLAAEPLADAYRLTLPVDGQARFLRFYFPGWRATLDGRRVAIAPDPRYGLIQVPVPAGTHDVAIRFGTTPARAAGWLLAALGLAGAALALARGGRPRPPGDAAPPPSGQRAQAGESRSDPVQTKTVALAIAVILLVAGLKTSWIEPRTRWFRQRSPVDAPLAMQHAIHAQFANGIELIGYDQRGPVRQGDELWVRLYWRAVRPLDADFSPFLHLDAPGGEVTWANRTKLHAGDKPSRGWPVEFYVVDEYWLAVPKDTPAVVASLRAGWLDPQGQPVPTLEGGDAATLGQIRVTERSPLRPAAIPGGPAHRFGPAIRLLGHAAALTDMDGTPALDLMLYWQAERAVTEDYTVFVHVFDAANTKAAQGDGPPMNGWYPTSNWAPGQVVADRRIIPLPSAGSAGGPFTVAVGLYRLDDGSRLPVTETGGRRVPNDQVIIGVSP